MKNIQKNTSYRILKISDVRQINKLFTQLSDILQSYSLSESRHLVMVAQTSFEDALRLRCSVVNQDWLDSF